MNTTVNLEAFAPGEYIREELEARGWSQIDLAEILGRPTQAVSEIVTGRRGITPETATDLAAAFDTSAQLWMNLQASYDLAQVPGRDTVSRRARLYKLAPIKDMKKRGWISDSTNMDVIEAQVLGFYGIGSLNESIDSRHAARKSTDGTITPAQLAWLYRARNLAKAVSVTGKFSKNSVEESLRQLKRLKADPEETRRVPKVLADAGIRFLIVEPLPQTKIDGVCFWLDQASPVVALSFRFDRIDWFWHTLMHEMDHLQHREGMEHPTLDTELVGSDAQPFDQKNESEKRADSFAVQFLLEQAKLEDFIARVGPLYSKKRIAAFAHRMGVHPGIVIGQLQFRKRMLYSHGRAFLVSVREIVTSTALTDGWGDVVPI